MSNRTITHEVKLEKSVKIIIGIFAIGVFLNVFSPLLKTTTALAEWNSSVGSSSSYPFYMVCKRGCR